MNEEFDMKTNSFDYLRGIAAESIPEIEYKPKVVLYKGKPG